jgi:hypothetical protein
MDHKQSATPVGRRTRPFCPDWNNCSTVEPSQKALFKKRLLFALDARAGAFPAQLTQITHPQNFANGVRVRVVSCDNSRSLVPVRIGLSKFVSSCCRYRPGVMLLRPRPADNNTRQGFSEAFDPLRRNLRGVQAPRGCVNRVPVPPTRSH